MVEIPDEPINPMTGDMDDLFPPSINDWLPSPEQKCWHYAYSPMPNKAP